MLARAAFKHHGDTGRSTLNHTADLKGLTWMGGVITIRFLSPGAGHSMVESYTVCVGVIRCLGVPGVRDGIQRQDSPILSFNDLDV